MMFFGMISSASLRREFLAPHTIAQRDGDGAFRVLLADDILVEFGDDLARREFVQRELFFFGGCG